MFTIAYPMMIFTAAPWESASSIMSSIALVAVALYMVALVSFPYMAKKQEDEPSVENHTSNVESSTKVNEDAVDYSTDEGETTDESDCEMSGSECTESPPPTPTRRRTRVLFNEDLNETTIIASCLDPTEDTTLIDMSSIWGTTSFSNNSTQETADETIVWAEAPKSRPPPGLDAPMVRPPPGLEAPTVLAPPGLQAPTYSANFLLAAKPRTPPGLAPVNGLGYKTQPRPVCDEASWGLPEKQEETITIFSSYHKKQERVQQNEVAKARAETELAARRASRPAAPWKRQTAGAEWRI